MGRLARGGLFYNSELYFGPPRCAEYLFGYRRGADTPHPAPHWPTEVKTADAKPADGKKDVKKGSKQDVDAIGDRGIGNRGLGNWYSLEKEIAKAQRKIEEPANGNGGRELRRHLPGVRSGR